MEEAKKEQEEIVNMERGESEYKSVLNISMGNEEIMRFGEILARSYKCEIYDIKIRYEKNTVIFSLAMDDGIKYRDIFSLPYRN